MFHKILIANRGEIAVRIVHACRELGITTVAVYSEADATASHVWLADEAALIGPSPSAESYLRIDKILNVAEQLGCDAIHPGFGFLAENAGFAEAVTAAGITFIGPAAQTIRMMGSKTAARAAMESAGVPIVPGYQDAGSHANLLGAAAGLGYPLLVKAVAGGGGKGMRIVHSPAEMSDALLAARSEANSAFGDDRLYLEQLIEHPRHIEFQIAGDHQGNIIHLFERECSIQRRHQKIVEETPSPFLTPELRQQMGEAAVAAARAANYFSVGTVEFLVDEHKNFYFLEMNTRLQVEHPITEMVTGIDLVKLQIRVAAGEPLPYSQVDLVSRGHAIECRIYAEDPANDFLPSTGQIHFLKEPVGPGIRVDSGIKSGDEISIHYDPMLAKVIVLADSRADAIARMTNALRSYVVLGDLVTNIPFLLEIVRHSAFTAGQTTTGFVEHHMAGWTPLDAEQDSSSVPHAAIVAAILADVARETSTVTGDAPDQLGDPYSPWHQSSGFRMGV